MEKHKQRIKNLHHKIIKRIKGFTIVELLVVIVIIGVLATIGVVSYGEITKKVAVSQVKNDLLGAAAAMKRYKSFNNAYPASLPSDYKYSSDTLLTGPGGADDISVAGGIAFCIEASSKKRSDIGIFSITSYDSNVEVAAGNCESSLIAHNVFIWDQITSGQYQNCGISKISKNAFCWGGDGWGQRGDGGSGAGPNTEIPLAVSTSGVLSGKTIKSISAGFDHTCAIASDDKAYCWGLNTNGGVGDNSTSVRYSPVAVNTSGALAGKTIKKISAGYYYTCAIASDDKAYCWGINGSGQLGDNSTTQRLTAVAVDATGVLSGKVIQSIAAGYNSTCAITTEEKAYCWGANANGQLGNNTTNPSSFPVEVDSTGVLSGKTVKSISVGSGFACAKASDNKAYCWGANANGQLGNNTTNPSSFPVAVDSSGVLSGKTINSITTKYVHVCAIASDEQVYCWGNGTDFRLGVNSENDSLVPTAVDKNGAMRGKAVKSLSLGKLHSCAIAVDDLAYCWGSTDSLRLGYRSIDDKSYKPSRVAISNSYFSRHNYLSATDVSIGESFSCAIKNNIRLYCWGNNISGQLGNGTIETVNVPHEIDTSGVLSGKTIKSVSVGIEYVCVIASDDNVYCWGLNSVGQVGNNSTSTPVISPVAVYNSGVLAGKTIKSISSRGNHSCVIASDDNAYCWGYANPGGLGDAALNTSSRVPVTVDRTGVLAGKTIKYLSTSYSHTCAIASDNKAYCWGSNSDGQLGNGLTTTTKLPVAVDTTGALSGKTIKSISAGGGHTCAIASDDKAYCWGSNATGQLGINSTTQSLVPVAVDTTGVLSGKTIKSIDAMPSSSTDSSTCAIASDDKAYCWGYNYYGVLGDGTSTNRLVPTAVSTAGVLSGQNITKITTGKYHTCALNSLGGVFCWGGRVSPVTVPGLGIGQYDDSDGLVYDTEFPSRVWDVPSSY